MSAFRAEIRAALWKRRSGLPLRLPSRRSATHGRMGSDRTSDHFDQGCRVILTASRVGVGTKPTSEHGCQDYEFLVAQTGMFWPYFKSIDSTITVISSVMTPLLSAENPGELGSKPPNDEETRLPSSISTVTLRLFSVGKNFERPAALAVFPLGIGPFIPPEASSKASSSKISGCRTSVIANFPYYLLTKQYHYSR